jgi:hypothetical protein
MIDRALLFLRDQLNADFARSGGGAGEGLEDAVAFPEGDKLDPLNLRIGAITVLLVNLEQDMVMRNDDPFSRILADGSSVRANPPIRLNLYLLLVARFHAYEAGLGALSRSLIFFQANPLFESGSWPALDPAIERLTVELHTLPTAEQNDLWGSLRLAYHPSLLFKVRMVAFRDGAALAAAPVADRQVELAHAVQAAP